MFVMPWIVHRDARFFPDPERFEPERWRVDPLHNGKLPGGVYLPFGGGPRVCLGAAFAMLEAKLLLASIAQRFRVALVPDRQIKLNVAATLAPRDGLRMVLHERA